MTTGANPVLYVSNSNPPNNIDIAGEIYKMRSERQRCSASSAAPERC